MCGVATYDTCSIRSNTAHALYSNFPPALLQRCIGGAGIPPAPLQPRTKDPCTVHMVLDSKLLYRACAASLHTAHACAAAHAPYLAVCCWRQHPLLTAAAVNGGSSKGGCGSAMAVRAAASPRGVTSCHGTWGVPPPTPLL